MNWLQRSNWWTLAVILEILSFYFLANFFLELNDLGYFYNHFTFIFLCCLYKLCCFACFNIYCLSFITCFSADKLLQFCKIKTFLLYTTTCSVVKAMDLKSLTRASPVVWYFCCFSWNSVAVMFAQGKVDMGSASIFIVPWSESLQVEV